jgi:hypothetical protein
MSIFTKTFWAATLERAIKTFCQTAAALIVGNGLGIEYIESLDWAGIASVSAIATLVSVLTSVATHSATQRGPGVGTAETLSPPASSIPVT